jgi:hypothetical protein
MNISTISTVTISTIIMVVFIWLAYYGRKNKSMSMMIALILVGLGACIFGFSFVYFAISKNNMEASFFTGIMFGMLNGFWFWVLSKTKLFRKP